MISNDVPASLNYEAEYEKLSHELKVMSEKNMVMREELAEKDREIQWLYGFKCAVDTIFSKDD